METDMTVKTSHGVGGRRLLSGCVAAAMGLTGMLNATPASAATANQMQGINFGYGDVVYNYDFTTTRNASYRTVDWATSVIYYNNANVNNVKRIAQQDYNYFTYGGTEYGYMVDGYGSRAQGGGYDDDRGVKTGYPSCFGSTRHSRVYAPSATDTMYNPSYGYFVFATTHIDHHEGCNDSYGNSESTEGDLANLYASKGIAVYRNYGYLYNAEHRDEGNHHWDNNGYATYIRMP